MNICANRIKPLYQVSDHVMIIWSRGEIGQYDLTSKRIISRIRVSSHGQKLISAFRIMERLFRLESRSIEAITDKIFIFSFQGAIYKADFLSHLLVREQTLPKGMSNPLSLSKIENMDSFEDSIVYGEYRSNNDKKPVSVYSRNLQLDGHWEKVYQFEQGTINHIHSIIPDRFRKVVYILTGDDDESSGIWVARDNWKTVEPLLVGKQLYRSCFALVQEEGLTFVTDTPFQQNAVYFIDMTSSLSNIPIMIKKISGSCIYGTYSEDQLLFSTTVEPDAKMKFYRYLFTKRRGAGILDDKVHVYCGNNKKGYKEIVTAKKDKFPMGLLQFGSVQFPVNSYQKFHKAYAYFTATNKLDGKWGEFYV